MLKDAIPIKDRRTATYPLGPHQEEGNPLWEQGSVFQPWRQASLNDPYYGMAMYAGFVQTQYPMWVPSYQPGMATDKQGFWMAQYSGFVNEHNLKGI